MSRGARSFTVGRVALHEALAVGVAQDAALAPSGLRQQDAELVDAGRVELEELHVLHRDAPAVEQAGPVAREADGVGGDLEHPSEAAAGEERGLGGEHVEVAGGHLVRDHAGHPTPGGGARVVGEDHVQDLELVEEGDVPLHALLEERLQDHVAGAVRRVAGPAHGGLAVVAGVATEAALIDLALGRAVERQAEVLQLDDGVDGLLAHDLDGRLVTQVVGALDRVEGVPLPGVLLDVGEGGAHAALGGAGVGTGGVELGQDRDPALAGDLDGRPQARAARADDHRVVAVMVDVHARDPRTPRCTRRSPRTYRTLVGSGALDGFEAACLDGIAERRESCSFWSA